MRIRFWLLAAFAALANPCAANVSFAGEKPDIIIGIDNFTFAPAEVTVKAGTKVAFVNHDDLPHSVVIENGRTRSQPLDADESFSFIFDKPGEVIYFCGLHPQMTGKIIVTPR